MVWVCAYRSWDCILALPFSSSWIFQVMMRECVCTNQIYLKTCPLVLCRTCSFSLWDFSSFFIKIPLTKRDFYIFIIFILYHSQRATADITAIHDIADRTSVATQQYITRLFSDTRGQLARAEQAVHNLAGVLISPTFFFLVIILHDII